MNTIIDGKLTIGTIDKRLFVTASYQADKQDKYRIDDIIAGYTGIFPCNWGTPPSSHSEGGVFVNGKLWFASSTSRPELGERGVDGVRWIEASVMLRNPERWILHIEPMSRYDIGEAIGRANSLVGWRYDKIGVVLDFAFPSSFRYIIMNWFKKAIKKIYCSKFTWYMKTGKMKRMSPRQLTKRVSKTAHAVILPEHVQTWINDIGMSNG